MADEKEVPLARSVADRVLRKPESATPQDIQLLAAYVYWHELDKLKPKPTTPDPDRGTGRTTAQMKYAPQGATYIYPGPSSTQFLDLARKIGRSDLAFVPATTAANYLRGRSEWVVVDHEVKATPDLLNAASAAIMRKMFSDALIIT